MFWEGTIFVSELDVFFFFLCTKACGKEFNSRSWLNWHWTLFWSKYCSSGPLKPCLLQFLSASKMRLKDSITNTCWQGEKKLRKPFEDFSLRTSMNNLLFYPQPICRENINLCNFLSFWIFLHFCLFQNIGYSMWYSHTTWFLLSYFKIWHDSDFTILLKGLQMPSKLY